MTGADADARPDHRSLSKLAVRAMVGIVLGVAAGWAPLAITGPSDDELQRAVLDEVGLAADLESAPVIGPTLDAYTERIEARILDETRPSATLALAVGVIVGVTGTVAACAAGQRSRSAQDHRSHDDREMAHGRRY